MWSYVFLGGITIIAYIILRSIFLWHLQISPSVRLLLDSMTTDPDSWERVDNYHFKNKKLQVSVKKEYGYDYSTVRLKIHESQKDEWDLGHILGTNVPLNQKEYRAVHSALRKLDTRWDSLEEQRKRDLLFNTVSDKLIED